MPESINPAGRTAERKSTARRPGAPPTYADGAIDEGVAAIDELQQLNVRVPKSRAVAYRSLAARRGMTVAAWVDFVLLAEVVRERDALKEEFAAEAARAQRSSELIDQEIERFRLREQAASTSSRTRGDQRAAAS